MFTLKNRKTSRQTENAPQIFDLLQLSKKERDCRAYFLSVRKNLQGWDALYEIAGTREQKFFLRAEGKRLHREAIRAVRAYRIVRRERVRLFRHYVESLPSCAPSSASCEQ